MKRCAAFGRNDCVLFLLQFYVFYVFTSRAAFRTPFGEHIFFFYVFSDRSTSPTTSGGSIFLLVKKDRGERHAKGLQSRPLESCFYTGVWRGDVRTPYEFAQMQFTRFRLVRWRAGGVRFARLRRKAKHRLFATISLPQALLPPDSCLLHVLRLKSSNLQNNQRIANFAVGLLRECKPFHRTAARRGKGISGAPQPT